MFKKSKVVWYFQNGQNEEHPLNIDVTFRYDDNDDVVLEMLWDLDNQDDMSFFISQLQYNEKFKDAVRDGQQ